MLPSNYDSSIAKHPELRPVLHRLSEWVARHEDWDLIDPRILSKDLRDVSPSALGVALEALIDDGLLKQVFMLASPGSGVLADGEYNDLNELPETFFDRSQYVPTSEAEIVAVLKGAR